MEYLAAEDVKSGGSLETIYCCKDLYFNKITLEEKVRIITCPVCGCKITIRKYKNGTTQIRRDYVKAKRKIKRSEKE